MKKKLLPAVELRFVNEEGDRKTVALYHEPSDQELRGIRLHYARQG